MSAVSCLGGAAGVLYCSGPGLGSHLWPVVILADNIHQHTLLTPRSRFRLTFALLLLSQQMSLPYR